MSSSRHTRLRRSREAFTLLEAVVVVVLIAVIAAIAMPSLGAAIARRRAQEATGETVRIAARARSEALAYGRAHVLVFTPDSIGDAGDSGRLELWRGRVDTCAMNDWAAIIDGDCADNPNCRDAVDFGRYDHGTHRVLVQVVGAADGASFCYQPNGDMYFSSGGAWNSTPPSGSEAVRIQVTREVEGATEGVPRLVSFPFGGSPRVIR